MSSCSDPRSTIYVQHLSQTPSFIVLPFAWTVVCIFYALGEKHALYNIMHHGNEFYYNSKWIHECPFDECIYSVHGLFIVEHK